MIADKENEKKRHGNGKDNADQGSNANKGIATETQGRENNADLYENDVLGKMAKRKKNDIWSMGSEKRTKFKDE